MVIVQGHTLNLLKHRSSRALRNIIALGSCYYIWLMKIINLLSCKMHCLVSVCGLQNACIPGNNCVLHKGGRAAEGK